MTSIFILSLVVAVISWTVTHEEIVREFRDRCKANSLCHPKLPVRKFCYVFTCEYCFSHYVALNIVGLSGLQLVCEGWRGYFIAWLTLVGIANLYMAIYFLLKLCIRYVGALSKTVPHP